MSARSQQLAQVRQQRSFTNTVNTRSQEIQFDKIRNEILSGEEANGESNGEPTANPNANANGNKSIRSVGDHDHKREITITSATGQPNKNNFGIALPHNILGLKGVGLQSSSPVSKKEQSNGPKPSGKSPGMHPSVAAKRKSQLEPKGQLYAAHADELDSHFLKGRHVSDPKTGIRHPTYTNPALLRLHEHSLAKDHIYSDLRRSRASILNFYVLTMCGQNNL
jgi:hypothetical protein